MDLLYHKSFFIPTSIRARILSKKIKEEGLVPYATQDDFKFSDLEMVHDYKGFAGSESRIEWATLFEVLL
jgi:hypothetical protein